MKTKQIALSEEQMKTLQELGVDTSDASMCWVHFESDGNEYTNLVVHSEMNYESANLNAVPAFTLQDILDKLPIEIQGMGLLQLRLSPLKENFGKWVAEYEESETCRFLSESLLEASYRLLCWCSCRELFKKG